MNMTKPFDQQQLEALRLLGFGISAEGDRAMPIGEVDLVVSDENEMMVITRLPAGGEIWVAIPREEFLKVADYIRQ